MGKPAPAIIEEKLDWVHDRVLYTAVDQLTENLDEFPVVGMGLAFVRRSAEDAIMRKVEQSIIPQSEEHLQVQMAFMRELAEAEDRDAVIEAYETDLLEADFVWKMADGPENAKQAIQDDILEENVAMAERAADWIEEAEGETFRDYIALADFLGHSDEKVVENVRDMFFVIDIIEKHRDHLDPGNLSSVLDHSKIREWFLDTLIEGLTEGRETIMTEIKEEVEERRSMG